ncbi:hypothetical protein [Desulfonema magnum]|uniref:Uncharacterized protein n=1 Tax=Desulfonema magnum TaxID=45655 RepID=A0A975BEU8_9BACT|nr:hypothetical protein [Desulfonema magnum]QTA84023.1 Uncharacterized protein dnm_000150 [Desulfonema magnum]
MFDYLSEWKTIIFMLIAFLCVLLIKFISKGQKQPFSDHAYISKMAKKRGCSEFDIFFLSAEEWHISKKRIECDFKEYLLYENVPYYVKDFVRKTKKKG